MSEHPPIVDLVEHASEPSIDAHLQSCASCRARARLFSQLDDPHLRERSDAVLAQRRAEGLSSLSRALFGLEETDEVPSLVEGRVIDRYLIEGLAGRGGMGAVYRVRHVHLGSLHALKVLRRTSPSVQARLVREGRAQSQLRHPNVVPVTDIVDIDGTPGLILEFVDGPTLSAHLRERGRLPFAEVDALAGQIIRGVGAAHAAGIVHRDLKPGNVLLAPTDEGPVAKVTDFGLAAAPWGEEEPATGPGALLGTPAYMSPEQIRDSSAADAQSDVFSLGALLYELVTGERAFEGTSLADTLDRVRAGRHRPVRELAPDVPPRVHAAIEGALQIDRTRRLADCRALLSAWRGTEEARHPQRRWAWLALPAAGLVLAGVAAVAIIATLGGEPPPPAAARQLRLTAVPRNIQIYAASLSPDGSSFAYVDGDGLWEQSVSEGSARLVLAGADLRSVHHYPDGERVLVAGRRNGEDGLWAVRLADGVGYAVSPDSAMQAEISPDGTRIALATERAIWVEDTDGNHRQRLRSLSPGDHVAALAWSPSGEYLASVQASMADDSVSLDVLATDGSSARRLVESSELLGFNLASLAWLAPDTLTYARTSWKDETPTATVWALDGAETATDAGSARVVQHWSDLVITRLRASEDGHRVLYATATAESSVQTLALNPPDSFVPASAES